MDLIKIPSSDKVFFLDLHFERFVILLFVDTINEVKSSIRRIILNNVTPYLFNSIKILTKTLSSRFQLKL